MGVIGSNGAGKTTLLKMMVGLLRPTKGEIRLFGEPIRKFRDWDRIGYGPQ
ncbi:putative ABC transporter ATP-binding protein YxlF [compost metagenome]